MLTGLYRTLAAAAATRWPNKVSCVTKKSNKVSCLIKMMAKNRCMNSSPNLDIAEENEGAPKSWNTSSKLAFEEEFPSLSASISSKKSKRRSRIDLGAYSEQKSADKVENIIDDDPLRPHQASSSSISHKKELCLPTSFGKKKKQPPISPCWKLRLSNHECGTTAAMESHGDTDNKCFDICLPPAADVQKYKASANRGGKAREKYWVPKVVQSAAGQDGQHKHNMEVQHPVEEESGKILRPGMVLFKSYIPLCEQVEIVKRCRELGCGKGGFYRPGYNDGAKLRLHMMCLGLDWDAQTRKYGKIRQHDNTAPPDIPHEFTVLVNRVVDDCHSLITRNYLQKKTTTKAVDDLLPRMSPDVCIVNFYTTNGRLGLHQDRDESRESLMKGLPVVSISIGDSAEFLYSDERDIDKAESIVLDSGDVLIFGGESRHVFHGVTTIYPNTAPPTLLQTSKLRPGRLNLTFRKY